MAEDLVTATAAASIYRGGGHPVHPGGRVDLPPEHLDALRDLGLVQVAAELPPAPPAERAKGRAGKTSPPVE